MMNLPRSNPTPSNAFQILEVLNNITSTSDDGDIVSVLRVVCCVKNKRARLCVRVCVCMYVCVCLYVHACVCRVACATLIHQKTAWNLH